MSLCDKPMRELSNPGASGSIFYLSHDDKFIIKTVQKGEHQFLLRFFQGYYMVHSEQTSSSHVRLVNIFFLVGGQNLTQAQRNKRSTLLPKFFGLFCYSTLGKNIRFIVMNNILPSHLSYYQK